MNRRFSIFFLLLVCSAAVSRGQQVLSTGPVHRYSFNNAIGTAANGASLVDSIGTANAVIRGSGATFTGTALTLPGGASSTAPYVDLPNGTVSGSAVQSPGYANASYEFWVTLNLALGIPHVFDFGAAGAAEFNAPGGTFTATDSLYLTANVGPPTFARGGSGFTGGGSQNVTSLSTTGTAIHFVVTYDGAWKLYKNGALVSTMTTLAGPDTLPDVNAWLGRSNTSSDVNANLAYNEFRIYNYALNAQQILGNYQAGPDVVTSNAPPAFLTAFGNNAAAALAWGAVPGATGYNVKRSTTSGGPYTTIATGLTGTNFNNTGLTNYTTYYYVVSAVLSTGETLNSMEANATPPGTPVFQSQPNGYSGSVGDTFSLQTLVASSPTYQWQRSPDGVNNWSNVGGAVQNTLSFNSSHYADNGFYRVTATNTNGSATSNVVQVTLVYPAPQLSAQPASLVINEGSDAMFFVSATGLGSLGYQWFKGANAIAGATSNVLPLGNVNQGAVGSYWVRVSDNAATADGLPATITDSLVATLGVFPAGLVSHDPFDTANGYVAGELPGQNPVIAFYAGAWSDIDFGDAEPAVTTGSLHYEDPHYLGSSGDKVSVATNTAGGEINAANSGRVYRLLEGALKVDATTRGTRYLSFLFQSGQETGAISYQTLHLNQGNGDANRNFDIGLTNNGGQPGTNYNFSTGGTYTSTGVAANADVHLFVVKFELGTAAASDTVTVWVDPALGAGDPAGGVVASGANLAWDRLCFSDFDGNSAAWDEIRWGSTFDSVTLKPVVPNNFAAWISNYPAVGVLNGFDDDADHDGIKNGLENFFGTDPSVVSQGITQVTKSGGDLSFRHPQSGSPASDVSISYRWSTDLITFHSSASTSDGTTVTVEAASDTPTAGITTATARVAGIQPAKLFIVLEATQMP